MVFQETKRDHWKKVATVGKGLGRKAACDRAERDLKLKGTLLAFKPSACVRKGQ